MGETLARTELFIMFTKLFQTFKFEASPDHPKPTLEPIPGVILPPKPYYAVATERQNKHSSHT